MQERFQTFTILIARLNRCIRKIKTEEMAELDLKSPHVSCLYYLYKSDSLTSKELCDICEEDKATISRGLDFLEENGFIVCESKLSKRYKSPLVLTEKGTEVGKKITEKINFVLDEICIDLTDAQREEFYRCLSLISDSLALCAKGIR